MGKKISQGGTNPYPGVQQYLKVEWSRRGEWNRSQYNTRAREIAAWAINFLILFSEGQPEEELAKVLTDQQIDRLAAAFLTQSTKKSRKTDPNLQSTKEREYRIATMLMEKGLDKCTERFRVLNPHNRELFDFIGKEAYKIALILAAPERRAIQTPLEYHYNPNRYKGEK